MTLSISDIRQKLVIACQEEYDRRIESGIHPYAIPQQLGQRPGLLRHIDCT